MTNLQLNSQPKNLNTYIYIGSGYSVNGYGGYIRVTVAQCFGLPSIGHWAKRMKKVASSPKLYNGKTENCQSSEYLKNIEKEYPNAVYVDDSMTIKTK